MLDVLHLIVRPSLKEVALYIGLILFSVTSFGQKLADESASTGTSQIIPPSPNAAALGTYGDVPVSLYTGLPSITVPLYASASTKSLSLNLSYRASGIRVNDLPSWVGLGWTLNVGGVITRTVHGLPDEDPQNGYLRRAGDIDRYLLTNNAIPFTEEQRYNLASLASDNKWDLEPDTYSFNFGGHSGQFVFDHQGRIVMLPYQKLEVVARTDSSGFRVTAEDGTIYHFLTVERSINAPNGDDSKSQSFISSWYLSRIEPVKGRSTKFNYASPTTIVYPASYQESISVLLDNDLPIDAGVGISQAPIGRQTPKPTYNQLSVDVRTLQSVTTPSEHIVFYSSPRANLLGTSAIGAFVAQGDLMLLDSVQVYTAEQHLSHDFVFTYTQQADRIFLQKVFERIPGKLITPGHSFEYKGDYLPPLYSAKQDHWGYYTRKNLSTTLLPATQVVIGSQTPGISSRVITVGGANRSIDTVAMQAGTLTKIVYPTGGHTILEYEAHDYGFKRQTAIPSQVITKQKQFQLLARLTSANPNEAHDSIRVVFTKGQKIKLTARLVVGSGTRDDTYAQGEIGYINRALTTPKHVLLATGGNSDDSVYLERGVYVFYVLYERLRTGSTPGSASLSIGYNDSVGTQNLVQVGGLRIRKVISHAGNGQPNLIKHYKYRLSADPTRSSGSLISDLPSYQYRYQTVVHETGGSSSQKDATYIYALITSTGNGQQGLTQGSVIGYREVTIIDEQPNLGGKSVFFYSSGVEYGDVGSSDFPFAPATSYDHRRGSLVQTLKYKFKDGQFQLAQRTRNYYSLTPQQSRAIVGSEVVGLKFGRTVDNISSGFYTAPYPDQFDARQYKYIAEWIYPTLVKDRIYASTDTTSYFENVEKLYYSNSAHAQITSKQVSTNTGEYYKTIYKYPLDFHLPNSTSLDKVAEGIRQLQYKHILTPVVEKLVWRRKGLDSVLVKGELMHYEAYQLKQILQLEKLAPVRSDEFVASTILPDGTFQQDEHYAIKQVLDQHDSFGNLVQQHIPKDVPTSYLWGYSQTQLLASIQNANVSQVDAALLDIGVSRTSLNTLTNEPQLRSIFTQLRQRLPQARIISFTYSPLVGITSQVSADGRILFYEYDSLSRLLRVRDEQGRILTQQEYKYGL